MIESASGSRPPAALSRWTGFLLAWVAGSGSEHYARALASVHLTPHQLGVLALLEDGPAKQAELSRRLVVFQPAMVALVNDLEAAGLVERRPHPTDRRAVEVHLLPAGAARIRDAEQVSRQATDVFFAPLTDRERDTFHALLAKLARGVSPDSPKETNR